MYKKKYEKGVIFLKKAVKLLENLFLIDGHDLGKKQRTGTYVLKTEDSVVLIETSASPSVPFILEGLNELNIDLSLINYLIVTHIHLDHAGGAGLLMQSLPNAQLLVHPKGKRHLADPSRLILGAKAVYGNNFDRLFDPIVPVPQERMMAMEHGSTVSLSPTHELVFYDTPGHANHHLSIWDRSNRCLYTGDTAGVFYPQLLPYGVDFILPSTSPNQFDPDKMRASLRLYESLEPRYIAFGHYGLHSSPKTVFNEVDKWLERFLEIGSRAANDETLLDGKVSMTAGQLYQIVQAFLMEKGVPSDHPVFEIIQLDLHVCAMGLSDYFQKRTN